jgi:hypothetical protein
LGARVARILLFNLLFLEDFLVKIRMVLITALVAAVAFGTAGCNLIQPQATTHHYDPSDGVGANVGDIKLRNLVLISDNGELGQLMFDAINTTGTSITLHVAFTINGKVSKQNVIIPSSEQPVRFGGPDERQVQLANFGVAPGGMIQLAFEAAGSETVTTFVPVLTTAQPEYKGLTPTPSPTPTPTQTFTMTSTPEPAPTETPAG